VLLAALLLSACPGNETEDPLNCPAPTVYLECSNGRASVTVAHHVSTSRYLPCREHDGTTTVTCAQGCALEGSETYPDVGVIPSAEILCAEAPVAKVGDACDYLHPCVPTRAQLAADGTVTGQTYLYCEPNAMECAVANPVGGPGHFDACDASIVAQYGQPNATGVVATPGGPSCLIAWDDTAKKSVSGSTRSCVGDWECAVGWLCDDQLQPLGADPHPAAVCKPGPRGTLAPAMLTK
jgi:hypothetical protein